MCVVVVVCVFNLARLHNTLHSSSRILVKVKALRLRNGKSVLGALVAGVVCGLVTWYYLQWIKLGVAQPQLVILAAIGGLAWGLSELLVPSSRPRPFLSDDNFIIPVACGFLLWLSFSWLDVRFRPNQL